MRRKRRIVFSLLLMSGFVLLLVPGCGSSSNDPAALQAFTWDQGNWDEVIWRD